MFKVHFLLMSFFGLLLQAHAAEFDQSHSRYGKVLKLFVREARVDYGALKKNPKELDRYLLKLASVPPAQFHRWSKEQQLALLLNLYNAQTLRLIIDHHPLKSIRSIGFVPGAAWRIKNVRFGGNLMTLSHLENEIIRKEYDEPRIHFALVCAALGCPPLRSEPYVGAKLEKQLEEQSHLFMAETAKNRFDASSSTLWLSPIFKWYKKDFTKHSGSLDRYVAPYLPANSGSLLKQAKKVRINYTDYDWKLNER